MLYHLPREFHIFSKSHDTEIPWESPLLPFSPPKADLTHCYLKGLTVSHFHLPDSRESPHPPTHLPSAQSLHFPGGWFHSPAQWTKATAFWHSGHWTVNLCSKDQKGSFQVPTQEQQQENREGRLKKEHPPLTVETGCWVSSDSVQSQLSARHATPSVCLCNYINIRCMRSGLSLSREFFTAVTNCFMVSSSIKRVWELENICNKTAQNKFLSHLFLILTRSVSFPHLLTLSPSYASPILQQLTQCQLSPAVLQSRPSSSSSTSELCGLPSCLLHTSHTQHSRLAAHTYLALSLANSCASLNCLRSIFLFLHTWCL